MSTNEIECKGGLRGREQGEEGGRSCREGERERGEKGMSR